MNTIDAYKMVLKGDVIKKLPNEFWQRPEAKENTYHYINENFIF